jgi:hypothetical protein
MSKSSTSYCLSKWGKTMTVETFNEFTDIKGKLVESNSRYQVSGENYSSRWIRASWYYFNKDIGIEEYGTNIVVGPVGSDFEITETYADLKDFIIYDDDKMVGKYQLYGLLRQLASPQSHKKLFNYYNINFFSSVGFISDWIAS